MPMGIISKLNQLFGNDWIEIEDSDTFALMLKNSDISPALFDAINAIKTLLVVDTPWKDIGIFENIVDALNSNPVLPTIITKPPIEDIMYAVYVMKRIQPDMEFDDDVVKYIAAIAIDNNLIAVLPPIDFANKYIGGSYKELQHNIIDFFSKYKDIDIGKIKLDISLPSIQIYKLLAINIAYHNKIKNDIIFH